MATSVINFPYEYRNKAVLWGQTGILVNLTGHRNSLSPLYVYSYGSRSQIDPQNMHSYGRVDDSAFDSLDSPDLTQPDNCTGLYHGRIYRR
jgi:hypothetical protein